MKRPTSVTVIGWLLIVMGGIALIVSTLSIHNPETQQMMAQSLLPIWVHYLMLYVGLAISIVSGAAMLKGENWSRYLYVGWSIFAFATSIFTTQLKAAMMPGLVIFIVIAIFLFRQPASDYFEKKDTSADAQSE